MRNLLKIINFTFFLVILSFLTYTLVKFLFYDLPYQQALTNYTQLGDIYYDPSNGRALYDELRDKTWANTLTISFIAIPLLNYLTILVFCLIFRKNKFQRFERILIPIVSSTILFSLVTLTNNSYLSFSGLVELGLFAIIVWGMVLSVYLGLVTSFTEFLFYIRKKLPKITLSFTS